MGNISVYMESMSVFDYFVNVTLTLYDDFNGVNVGNMDIRLNLYNEKDFNNLMNLIAISAVQTLGKVYFASSDTRYYKRVEELTRRLFQKFDVVTDRTIIVDIKNKDST